MSTADFLFTPSMQRVLCLVFANPGQSFNLTRLLEHAGGGHGGGQRQIERLLLAGLLQEGPRRALKRSIQVNTEFFMYPELRAIVLKSFGLTEPLQQVLQAFQEQISEAFVVGSFIQGTDSPGSEIDLIVVGGAPLKALNEAMLHIQTTLGRPVRIRRYGARKWAQLRQTDPEVQQLAQAENIRILPAVPLSKV